MSTMKMAEQLAISNDYSPTSLNNLNYHLFTLKRAIAQQHFFDTNKIKCVLLRHESAERSIDGIVQALREMGIKF